MPDKQLIVPSAKEGRPSKYTPELVNKVDAYIKTCGREQTSLPTVEGLALYLNVSRDSVYEWAKNYPEFSDTLKKLADKQKSQLIDDGMYGGKEVNASMAIFLLKANHGMKDGSTNVVNVNEMKVLIMRGKVPVLEGKSLS